MVQEDVALSVMAPIQEEAKECKAESPYIVVYAKPFRCLAISLTLLIIAIHVGFTLIAFVLTALLIQTNNPGVVVVVSMMIAIPVYISMGFVTVEMFTQAYKDVQEAQKEDPYLVDAFCVGVISLTVFIMAIIHGESQANLIRWQAVPTATNLSSLAQFHTFFQTNPGGSAMTFDPRWIQRDMFAVTPATGGTRLYMWALNEKMILVDPLSFLPDCEALRLIPNDWGTRVYSGWIDLRVTYPHVNWTREPMYVTKSYYFEDLDDKQSHLAKLRHDYLITLSVFYGVWLLWHLEMHPWMTGCKFQS